MRRGRVTAGRVLGTLVVLAAALYATFSLVTWSHYGNGGFDLGIFDQVVWHYSRWETPASSVKGLGSIYGDHVSPILALLAPLYWLWDDARVLLLAQAGLVAGAAVPVFLVCRDRVGARPALALAATYLAFWGVGAAIAFDVHEVAFAPVLLAGVLLAVQRRRWRWYAALVLALLCVKEDQAILVVFLGLYVATTGERRIGALTAVAGVAWYLVATQVVVPAANPLGFTYWSYGTFGDDPVSALGGVLRDPPKLLTTLVDAPEKRGTLALLVLPFLGLCLLSREVLLLAPMVAERLLSTNVNYWGTEAHYTLASAVVVVIGAAAGLRRVGSWAPTARRRLVVGAGAGVILLANLAVSASFPLADLTKASFWEKAPVWSAADRALAVVPPRASIAAQDLLVPRLTHREVAAEITERTGRTEYVAAYLTGPLGRGEAINGPNGVLTRFVDGRIAGAVPVAYEDGWLVLRRREAPGPPRAATLRPLGREATARLDRALRPWVAALGRRIQDARTCAAAGRGPCPGAPTFAAPQRALTAALAAATPGLAPGCAELARLAGFAALRLGADLDAVWAAGAARPANPAALAAAAAASARTIDANAFGFVTRFRALCGS